MAAAEAPDGASASAVTGVSKKILDHVASNVNKLMPAAQYVIGSLTAANGVLEAAVGDPVPLPADNEDTLVHLAECMKDAWLFTDAWDTLDKHELSRRLRTVAEMAHHMGILATSLRRLLDAQPPVPPPPPLPPALQAGHAEM